MGREVFLRELEFLLMDLPEEERQEALQYYQDYFEDAGPQREQEIVSQLGSPAKVAAELKGSLAGQEDGGEFSERGYRAEWYAEDNRVPDQYAEIVPKGNGKWNTDSEERESGFDRQSRRRHFENRNSEEVSRRRNGFLILVLFLIFGLPIAGSILSAGASVVAAVVAALFGGFAGLFGLLAGGAALVFGLFVAGVALVIAGCVNMSVPAIGAMVIGWGFLVLAAAFLLAVLVKWGFTAVVPGLIRFCIDLFKKGCRWVRSTVCRLRGKGGAAE